MSEKSEEFTPFVIDDEPEAIDLEARRSEEVDALLENAGLSREELKDAGIDIDAGIVALSDDDLRDIGKFKTGDAETDDFMAKTAAALEFLPEGEPVPYNAANKGLSFDERLADELIKPMNAAEYAKHVALPPPERIKPTVQSPLITAVLDDFYGTTPQQDPPDNPASTPGNAGGNDEQTTVDAKTPPAESYEAEIVPESEIDKTLEHAGVKPANGIISGFTTVAEGRSDDPINREIAKYDLYTESVATIKENFHLDLAPEWKDEAMAIVVTDASQTGLIKKAHDMRIQLRDERVRIEKVRKVLKERPLREGKAIDAVAGLLKGMITPVEEHLHAQEQYAARLESDRKARLMEERSIELAPFVESTTIFDLGSMSEEQWQHLLEGSKAVWGQREAEKIEAERLEAEKAEAQQKELEAAQARLARVNELSAAGFVFDAEVGFYKYDDGDAEGPLWFTIAELEADNFAEILGGLVPVIKGRQEQSYAALAELDRLAAEHAAKEAEAARLAIAPDKEKLDAYFTSMYNAAAARPELESKAARQLIEYFFDEVAEVTNRYAKEASQL